MASEPAYAQLSGTTGEPIPPMSRAELDEIHSGKVPPVQHTLSDEAWRKLYAGLAMGVLLLDVALNESAAKAYNDACDERGTTVFQELAKAAVNHADAALAELKRTEANDDPR